MRSFTTKHQTIHYHQNFSQNFGIFIDSISHRYGGTQKVIVKDNNGSGSFTIPLDLAEYTLHFRHRLPTTDEIVTLNQYY
jgi:hypothetical protein